MDALPGGSNAATARQRSRISFRPRQSITKRRLNSCNALPSLRSLRLNIEMDIQDYLSDDGQAVLALCSAFALPESSSPDAATPFKLSEWNGLERRIAESPLKTPAGLMGCSADSLAKALTIAPDEAERFVRLLERSGKLALELDNLFSRGMWAMTRVDEHYPARLRDTLKHQAPTVLFGSGELRLLQRSGIA